MDGFCEIIRDIERWCVFVCEVFGVDWRLVVVDFKMGYWFFLMFVV